MKRAAYSVWLLLLAGGVGLGRQRQAAVSDQQSTSAISVPPSAAAPLVQPATNTPTIRDIPEFALTNELGAPVQLRQFSGEAVALTFFFTRCPIPEFCPRLSKNFAEATRKLEALPNGPTNWHFFSISFDPRDTPAVLREYGQRYGYDSNHWSFVTGNPAHIQALAAGFGLEVKSAEGGFNHGFRTILFDASGRLQTIWPLGGNLSDALVREMVKGTAAQPPK